MNLSIPPMRIEWPEARCELFSGALEKIVTSNSLQEALGPLPTSQILLRDSAVATSALEPVSRFLSARGPLQEIEVAGGEIAKTQDSWLSILEILARARLDRGGLVIVAGGGALGDAAGFAASVWHRGVPWVAIPTTLLAMVDAHIGGKTAIHHGGIKNRIGSFHLPRLVLTDPSLLDTLPLEQRQHGWAELIKAAWIGDPELLQQLEARPDSISADLIPTLDQIAAAVAVKVSIVGQDPFEEGCREQLNLGHTLAHALEMNTTPPMAHGAAVARGMVFAAALAEEVSVARSGTVVKRVSELLARVGLPVDWNVVAPESVLAALRDDKKVRSGKQRWVLPKEPGQVVVEPVDESIVERVLRSRAPEPTVLPLAGEGSR